MTAIVILNILFSAFVVVGIVGLLAAGIVSDRRTALALRRRRPAVVRAESQRAGRRRLRPAYDAF